MRSTPTISITSATYSGCSSVSTVTPIGPDKCPLGVQTAAATAYALITVTVQAEIEL
jgi:hypothetical protein